MITQPVLFISVLSLAYATDTAYLFHKPDFNAIEQCPSECRPYLLTRNIARFLDCCNEAQEFQELEKVLQETEDISHIQDADTMIETYPKRSNTGSWKKRLSDSMRLGKRSDALRLGKRVLDDSMRLGKKSLDSLRLGKRSLDSLRLGKKRGLGDSMRLGKRSDLGGSLRLGKRPSDLGNGALRLGKRSDFSEALRLGKRSDMSEALRLGKRSDVAGSLRLGKRSGNLQDNEDDGFNFQHIE